MAYYLITNLGVDNNTKAEDAELFITQAEHAGAAADRAAQHTNARYANPEHADYTRDDFIVIARSDSHIDIDEAATVQTFGGGIFYL